MQVLIGKKENGDFAGELSINQRLHDEIATFYPLKFCQWLRKKWANYVSLVVQTAKQFIWLIISLFLGRLIRYPLASKAKRKLL